MPLANDPCWHTYDLHADRQPTAPCTEKDMKERLTQILIGNDSVDFLLCRYAVTNRLAIYAEDDGVTYSLTVDVDDEPSPEGSLITPMPAQYRPLIELWRQNDLVIRTLPEEHWLGGLKVVHVALNPRFFPADGLDLETHPVLPTYDLDPYLIAGAKLVLGQTRLNDELELLPNRWWVRGCLDAPNIGDLIGVRKRACDDSPTLWVTGIRNDDVDFVTTEISPEMFLRPTQGALTYDRQHACVDFSACDEEGRIFKRRRYSTERFLVCPNERYAKNLFRHCIRTVSLNLQTARHEILDAMSQQETCLLDIMASVDR